MIGVSNITQMGIIFGQGNTQTFYPNKRFILAENARIFREIQNKLAATDWKKEFHPVGFFIDFRFVSVLEEWARSGSAGSTLTHVDCSAIF